MRTRRRATIEDLRVAIDCLPRDTRAAMLTGISANQIIVGAYSNRDGICPMLAAHRAGGRTSAISFARAWDRFALRGSRSSRARRATERELLILQANLEASLLAEGAPEGGLAAARRDHLGLVARRKQQLAPSPTMRWTELRDPPADRVKPGDPDLSPELRGRPGWAWSRMVRRYDDYDRLLRRLDAERSAAEPRELEPTPGR